MTEKKDIEGKDLKPYLEKMEKGEVSALVFYLTKEEIEKITKIKEKFGFDDMTTALRYIINFCYDVEKKFNFFKDE
jgi:hypothetical protein